MPQPGEHAPDFTLPDADMASIGLARILARGHHVVLYFYPKDDTPGCTLEALEFSDLDTEFAAAGAEVVGISPDSCDSHGHFRDKHGLSIHLLADTDAEICQLYKVWREQDLRGVKRAGVLRSTFVIDRNGLIRHAYHDVRPRGHAAQMLEVVRALG